MIIFGIIALLLLIACVLIVLTLACVGAWGVINCVNKYEKEYEHCVDEE